MEVAPAAAGDAGGLAEVHVKTWQAAYRGRIPDEVLDSLSVAERRRRWSEILEASEPPATMTWVAREAGEIIGFASVCPTRDEDAAPGTGEVASLYVSAEGWAAGGAIKLDDRGSFVMPEVRYRRRLD
ncbi:MAG: GNAT family N-acetyltransferase [Acidimicrobiales bacterium]